MILILLNAIMMYLHQSAIEQQLVKKSWLFHLRFFQKNPIIRIRSPLFVSCFNPSSIGYNIFSCKIRGPVAGKTGKTVVLPRFWHINQGRQIMPTTLRQVLPSLNSRWRPCSYAPYACNYIYEWFRLWKLKKYFVKILLTLLLKCTRLLQT